MSEDEKLMCREDLEGSELPCGEDTAWQERVFREVLTESLLSKAETGDESSVEDQETAAEREPVEEAPPEETAVSREIDPSEEPAVPREDGPGTEESQPHEAPAVETPPLAGSEAPLVPPVPEEALLEELPPEPPQAAERPSKGQELYEWTQALVCAVLAVVLLFTFVVRLIGVDGHSMVPSLQHGDRLMVVTSFLDREFRAGDIVVARKESFLKDPIVKRIIATGGQTVDIDFESGSVYVDGQLLDEPYINERTYLEEGTAFPLTVPEGSVFLMGDNRNRSNDSRDSSLGTVDEGYIIGKATVLLFPGKDELTEERDFGRIGLLNR